MKIVVFGPERRIGALTGQKVIDLNRAFASYLREQRGDTSAQVRADERIPQRLENFIALGAAALEDADRAIQHVVESGVGLAAIVHDANSVKLRAPWPGRRIACVGGNYAAHLVGMWAGRPGVTGDLAQITRMAREEGQWGFWKNPHEVAGPDDQLQFGQELRWLDLDGSVHRRRRTRSSQHRRGNPRQRPGAPVLQYQRNDLAVRRGLGISLAGFHVRSWRRHRRRYFGGNRC